MRPHITICNRQSLRHRIYTTFEGSYTDEDYNSQKQEEKAPVNMSSSSSEVTRITELVQLLHVPEYALMYHRAN